MPQLSHTADQPPAGTFRILNQSSIHSLFGTGGLKCTVGLLVCSCISANMTELKCTLEIQAVDWRIKDLEGVDLEFPLEENI